jgi:hypothetical protein
MVMAGDRPAIDRVLARNLGDEVDLGQLLAVRALCAGSNQTSARHGN